MKKDKKKSYTKSLFPLLILLLTVFMSVGYAAVNSIIIGFDGEAIAKEVDGVFITEVNYLSNVSADLTKSTIINAYQTNLNSEIFLSNVNGNSSITYEITIFNSTDQNYYFDQAKYVLGDGSYDNSDISFRLDGLNNNDILESERSITFTITFYYNNYTVSNNNKLKSIINFSFEPVQMVANTGTLVNNGSDSSMTFNKSLSKSTIEAIYTRNDVNLPSNVVEHWDASVEGNNSIIAWTVDDDGNGLYELYLGIDNGIISFPEDSSYMFANFTGVKTIKLTNVDTSKVTNMNCMFYYNIKLTSFEVSNFVTTQVTDMGYMFYYAYALESLDLSDFDTSNVTNMNYMFAYSYKLNELRLDSASFGSVAKSSFVFYQLPSTVYIVAKDDTARNWIQEKLGSGKGTIVTVAEL